MNVAISRVLLIEDNPADAHLFGELLREAGAARIQLTHAGTVRAALECLASGVYDVALVDLSLPDASGVDAVVHLHSAYPALPLVVLTGLDDEAMAARAVREGAQDYLIKGRTDGALILRAMRYASERGRAIDVLQRREEHFRALIENALDLIAIVQRDGVIRYASPSHQRILGWRADELIGADIFSRIAPEDCGGVRGALEGEDNEASFEYRFLRKDGTWRTLESYARDLSHLAGVGGLVVSSRDVTERKMLEQQVLQAQKMDAIARLASGIAHDFNNLLTVISGYTHLLLGKMLPADPARGDMEQVARAAERAADLTRQLLAFSRRQLVRSGIVHMETLIAEVEPILRRVVGEGVDLVTSIVPGLPPVCADPGQIEQVLLNLALNARDAMPGGGTLAIEVSATTLDEESAALAGVHRGEHLTIQVRDTGMGMPPEVQARIFEPFFTTKEPGKGTGLGLSTSYGIIRQNNGNIRVESQTGRGTVFTVWLPVAPEAVSGRENGARTILLTEDEPDVRTVLETTLRRLGYHVLACAGAEEALDTVKRHAGDIDLLLADVELDGTNGYELAASIRAARPPIRVLFISGCAEGAGGRETSGVFLEKPFTPERLAAAVRDALARPAARAVTPPG